MSLLLYLLSITAAVSLCVVAFLLISAGNLRNFRELYEPKPKIPTLPIISKYGDLIASPQDLNATLTLLKSKLKEKYQEMEAYKGKMQSRMQSLEKLESFKKGCFEMQADFARMEEECNDLQQKIEYFKKLQLRIQEEFCPNTGFTGDSDWIMSAN